jgi:aminoglycoside phosphotransferase (APT) family kinase protein
MWIPDLADPARMTRLLADHAAALGLPGQVTSAALVDARLTNPHRPDSPRCTGWATYRLTTAAPDGRTCTELWYLTAHPTGTGAAAWDALRAGPAGAAARFLPDLDLVAWPFPHDPSLPGLCALLDPRSAAPYLDDAAGLDVDVVRYQPEASAVVRFAPSGPTPAAGVYAKLLAPGEADVARVAAQHDLLWTLTATRPEPALRVAEPLGADVRRRLLWTREVLGDRVAATLVPATADRLALRLAALTAELHTSGVAAADTFSLADHVDEARKKVAKMSAAHPAVGDRLAVVLARLEGDLAGVGEDGAGLRSVTVHGDLHVDQLLDTPSGLVLLDLDSVTGGPPELDLAELVVDLVLRPVPWAVTARFVPRLLDGYRAQAPDGPDPDVLRALAGAELVNRLYRHLRHHAPDWRSRLERELGRHADVRALLRTP